MGNCCGVLPTIMSYDKVSYNTCSICLFECSTKVCDCQYMHKECCQRNIYANGNKCKICARSFNTWFLQHEPKTSTSEDKIYTHFWEVSKAKKRANVKKIKNKAQTLLPLIIRFFNHYDIQVANIIIGMESIYTVQDTKEKYLQYCMSKGKKRTNIFKDLRNVQYMVEESRQDRQVKSCILQIFNQYKFTFDFTSESEIEFPLHQSF